MIINKIKLENFKSHKNTSIDFNTGISLILGSNGSGKSTILEAISYALFREVNGTMDDLIRKPADESDIVKKMLVTLEFSVKGNDYVVERGKQKNKNIAMLYRLYDGEKEFMISGATRITKEIEEKLEIDAKSFLNAVYIKQGDITNLIDKTPSERKQLISKLLNIESLDVASDEIKNIINEYKEEYSYNEGQISKKEEITEKNTELKNNITNNEKEIHKNTEENKQLKLKKEKLEKEITNMEEIKEEHDKLQKEITSIQKTINRLKKSKSDNDEYLEQIEDAEKQTKILKKDVEKLPKLRELKELKTELNHKNKELTDINEQIKQIEETKKTIENNQEKHDQYTKIKNEKEELEKEIKKLELENTNNKIIKNNLKEDNDRKKILFEKINKTATRANEIFNKQFYNPEEIETAVTDEKNKLNTFITDLEEQIQDNERKIASHKSDINRVKKSLKDLENTTDTCPICQSNISHEKHEELSQKYKDEILVNENRIEELTTANKNQEQKLNEKNKLLNSINEIDISLLKERNSQFNELIKKIKENEEKIPEITKLENSITEKQEEMERYNNELKDLEKYYEKYEFSIKFLDKQKSIDEINIIKKEKDNEFYGLKHKCQDIVRTVGVKDNLNAEIKHLEEKNKKYSEYQGLIRNKDKVLKIKEELDKDFDEKNSVIIQHENSIKSLEYNPEEYEEIQKEYKSLLDKIKEIDTVIIQLKTRIEKDQESIQENDKYLKEIEDIVVKQEQLATHIKLLEKIRGYYGKDGVQKIIRNKVRPDIERNTFEIFSEFDFDYQSITLDEEYNILIKKQNSEINLKMLSGGEKIVIALALRLGIARTITQNKTELLILDEPTIHLDAERRENLINIIREINIVPQMIIVSHDDEMESLSNNIIKISKVDGISSYSA